MKVREGLYRTYRGKEFYVLKNCNAKVWIYECKRKLIKCISKLYFKHDLTVEYEGKTVPKFKFVKPIDFMQLAVEKLGKDYVDKYTSDIEVDKKNL